MAEYVVESVARTRDWHSSQYGDFTSYYLRLKDFEGVNGVNGEVEIAQKRGSASISSGQTIDLEKIEVREYDGKQYLKGTKAKQGSGGGGRSPADTKAIQRQHSQEMGIRFVALCHQLGVTVPDAKLDDVMEAVKWATDAFEQDIGGGGASSETGTSDESEIAKDAAPSDALSSQRAKALEQSIANAGMTKDEVRILLGATGVAVGDDLYAAIASMTPEQASSIESFVETKQQMAAA